jgi:hypothetical protein
VDTNGLVVDGGVYRVLKLRDNGDDFVNWRTGADAGTNLGRSLDFQIAMTGYIIATSAKIDVLSQCTVDRTVPLEAVLHSWVE